ncbi:hypothetical protein Tsubulata_049253, partial [Turnera subulata]
KCKIVNTQTHKTTSGNLERREGKGVVQGTEFMAAFCWIRTGCLTSITDSAGKFGFWIWVDKILGI